MRWLALVLALAACSSDDEGSPTKTPPKDEFTFVATPTASGAAVSLRQKELTDTQLVLELVGHSVPDVYGIAFRLQYDSAVLHFDNQDPGSIFGAPLSLSSEKTPGLLVGVVTKKGASSGVNGSEQVLATLSFSIVKKEATSIGFVENRNSLIDGAGTLTPASWTGGALGFQ